MKSQEFLKEKLTYLSSKFKDVKIRYEYRKNTQSHIIEIIPLSIYNDDEKYMMAEAKLEDEFESLFINENIIFVSEDSLTEIKTPNFTLGYDVFFENQVLNYWVMDVEGFTNEVDFVGCEYYALAA